MEPNLDMIRSLTKLFNVSADYLLELDTPMDYEATVDLYDFLQQGKLTLNGEFLEPQDCEAISNMVQILMEKRKNCVPLYGKIESDETESNCSMYDADGLDGH